MVINLKIYKIQPKYKILLFCLSLSSLFFGLSHLFVKGNNIKFIALSFLSFFIIFTFINMVAKKIYIENDILHSKGLFSKKSINLKELCEASVINLKGRIMCVLSDQQNVTFLSSTIEGFMDILSHIIKIAPADMTEKLREIKEEEINSKNRAFIIFLVLANLFLIGLAIYNIV
jgi:archaellum biogenesis protein FlaJ (TadC family)